ncbi:CPBP family intramembrane glutamic endopeptidase [Mumia sp. DW29H23]|uniref:CPBP family intramembrane glutamic endopeptidase n=1 Tax=Mumia sp. DW29H23 TaxID=3421241 RepID=UPI003D6949A6
MSDSTARADGFWDRATTAKAVLIVVAYLVYYVLVGQIVGWLFGDAIGDDPLDSATGILLALVVPIAIGAVTLVVFAARLGWLRQIFGRQPVAGRGWMWIGPALVVAAIVGHVGSADWDAWGVDQIVTLALAGVCIGVAEELVTRGLAVKVLRDAGHSERYVVIVSSLLFALMHTANLISGMEVATVLFTLVYTFAFGTCMYLAMRVTGTIWAAIVLHACTDPTTILSVGGIDEGVGGQDGAFAGLALAATVGLIVFGFIAVLFVKGRAGVAPAAEPAPQP